MIILPNIISRHKLKKKDQVKYRQFSLKDKISPLQKSSGLQI